MSLPPRNVSFWGGRGARDFRIGSGDRLGDCLRRLAGGDLERRRWCERSCDLERSRYLDSRPESSPLRALRESRFSRSCRFLRDWSFSILDYRRLDRWMCDFASALLLLLDRSSWRRRAPTSSESEWASSFLCVLRLSSFPLDSDMSAELVVLEWGALHRSRTPLSSMPRYFLLANRVGKTRDVRRYCTKPMHVRRQSERLKIRLKPYDWSPPLST